MGIFNKPHQRRVRAQRLGWDNLTTVQEWMCEQVLGIEPATEK